MRVEVTRLTRAQASVAVVVIQGGRKNVFRPTLAQARLTEFVFLFRDFNGRAGLKTAARSEGSKDTIRERWISQGKDDLGALRVQPQNACKPQKGNQIGRK